MSKTDNTEQEREENQTQADTASSEENASPPETDEAVESVEAPPEPLSELEQALLDRETLKDQLLRARADFDNYRKRIARDNERLRKMAAVGVLQEVLPVLDNLDRALEFEHNSDGGLQDGVQMVRKQLQDLLEHQGVTPIPAMGHPFDPNVHEALAHIPSEEIPADSIVDEYLKGYMMANTVLRPAKVTVSSGAPKEETTSSGEPTENS